MAKKTPASSIVLKIICLVIWIVIAQFILQVLLALFFSLFMSKTNSSVINQIYSIVYYSLLPALIIYLPHKLLKAYQSSRKNLGLENLPTFSDIGLAPIAFIIYLILAFGLMNLFNLFPWFNEAEAQDIGLTSFASDFEKTLAFFSVCIFAPISEELIFRGWLYDKMRNLLPKKHSLIISILIVSVLFSALHGQWNVGVNVFALSIISCLLRETTGTIYSGILFHMLKNIVAFCLVYVYHIS